LLSDGRVFCWGDNYAGQSGVSSTGNQVVPAEVVPPASWQGKNVTAIAAGYDHSVALLSDGTMYTWGLNNNGQIGDGSVGANRLVPTAVALPAALLGRNVSKIGAGGYHTYALLCSKP